METNNLTIIPPEGLEAYQEGNEIKFRPISRKSLTTYNEVAKELFYDKDAYFIRHGLDTNRIGKYSPKDTYHCSNNCTSGKQIKKLMAINKLLNVARYLNGDWKPNWNESNDEFKYYIDLYNQNINIKYTTHYNNSFVYFKLKELANQAIKILGEETIRLALSTDW